ncbi:glycosyltransferase [Butyrivibrio sp. LC3010]|uniref:glycosyltransferase n=1 Tax=Butyrivibrio sp. LC3010 TaxID=1280680 RepID=UPI000407C9A3|nr:glycosyltransferase [Butyrivibrio sp. LC3010]
MSKDRYRANDHTFAICAYGESQFLEECIKSVLDQKLRTNVIMATSTPSQYLTDLSNKYGIKLFVNEEKIGKSNIATDWEFAVSCAGTPLVTIAHQDDIYKKDFSYEVINCINRAQKPLIAFTDYAELRNGEEVADIRNLNIKRIMLFPLRSRLLWASKFIRRRILSMGSPICCPSVTYVIENLPDQLFIPGYKGGIDWQAWERYSREKGDFVFVNNILMLHRIHADSETSAIIKGHERSDEDYAMFCMFWPKWIARIIAHFYRKGELQNNL